MSACNLDGILNFVFGQVGFFGYFVDAWPPFVLLFKLAKYLVDFVYRPNLVQWQANNAALLGNGLQDALPNPPYSIRNELETAGLVEFFGSFYQAHIALVDEVLQA